MSEQAAKFKGLRCTVEEASLVQDTIAKMPAETRAVFERLREGGDEAMYLLLHIRQQQEAEAELEEELNHQPKEN